jgi:hypothetical protein
MKTFSVALGAAFAPRRSFLRFQLSPIQSPNTTHDCMNTARLLLLLSALIVSALRVPPSAFAQGPLTPPGAPAPTMKTLDQIEARTDVLTLAGDADYHHIITQAGSYYLSGNLFVTKPNGIYVRLVEGVTIDLNGFRDSPHFREWRRWHYDYCCKPPLCGTKRLDQGLRPRYSKHPLRKLCPGLRVSRSEREQLYQPRDFCRGRRRGGSVPGP